MKILSHRWASKTPERSYAKIVSGSEAITSILFLGYYSDSLPLCSIQLS